MSDLETATSGPEAVDENKEKDGLPQSMRAKVRDERESPTFSPCFKLFPTARFRGERGMRQTQPQRRRAPFSPQRTLEDGPQGSQDRNMACDWRLPDVKRSRLSRPRRLVHPFSRG